MGKASGGEDRLSVVLVDRANSRAIVPSAGGDHLLPVPEGSVTVEAIRRAARRVGERRGGNIVAIAEAAIERRRR